MLKLKKTKTLDNCLKHWHPNQKDCLDFFLFQVQRYGDLEYRAQTEIYVNQESDLDQIYGINIPIPILKDGIVKFQFEEKIFKGCKSKQIVEKLMEIENLQLEGKNNRGWIRIMTMLKDNELIMYFYFDINSFEEMTDVLYTDMVNTFRNSEMETEPYVIPLHIKEYFEYQSPEHFISAIA